MLPRLRETQAAMRRALLAGDDGGLVPHLAAAGVLAATQIAVYRNNVFASLTEVLRDTFPAIGRLVDERFFAYAAHEFIRQHPPTRPCLSEYGAQFPDFLAAFPPCRELSYLADVARFEWLLSRAAHAENAVPIDPSALASLAPEDTPRLVLQLDPSLGFLASPWPIDRIWQANRSGAADGAAIDLGVGGVRLEIGRGPGGVTYRSLDAATFAFRQALDRGTTLEAATVLALAIDDGFDVAAAFANLFRDRVVTRFALAEPTLQ
jgi:Putative DNA-binding domain